MSDEIFLVKGDDLDATALGIAFQSLFSPTNRDFKNSQTTSLSHNSRSYIYRELFSHVFIPKTGMSGLLSEHKNDHF